MDKSYCVYMHKNKITNEIFYIGMGNRERPYLLSKNRRNHLWGEYVDKIGGKEFVEVEIVLSTNNKREALEKETALTQYYKNKGECICNKAIGSKIMGEYNGFFNKKHSEDTKKKISISKKGKEPWNKGKVNIYSQETLEKMRASKLGIKYSDEINKKKGLQGEQNPMYGKSHSKESKKKIGESYYTRKLCKKTCVICGIDFEARNGRNKYCEKCKDKRRK